MDPVFYAGLNLGSAEIYRQIVKDESGFKDGSPFVNTAASLLSRARDTNFSGIVKHLQEIGRDWKGRFPELPNVLEAIQQVEGVAGAVYQKVSCGFMLGQAMETCRQAKKKTVVAEAKANVISWINRARDHAVALSARGFYPQLPDYSVRFNSVSNPIHTVKQSSEFLSHSDLIEALAKDLGNAISRQARRTAHTQK